jgi:hypothetical protein
MDGLMRQVKISFLNVKLGDGYVKLSDGKEKLKDEQVKPLMVVNTSDRF